MSKEYLKSVEEFGKNESARRMLLHSLKILLPDKKNRFGLFVSMLLAIIFASIIGHSENAVEFASSSANTILNVQLAIFAVILTVYSIIFVFFDDEKLKIFAKNQDPSGDTFLNLTATFYQSAMFLYFINITTSGVVVLLMGILDKDFRLTNSLNFDRGLAIGLLFIYFTLSFRVFYELKSILYNTIQLFRLGVLRRLKNYMDEKGDE